MRFQPTRPVRGETRPVIQSQRKGGISTHSPRAGRDGVAQAVGVLDEISTHSPRAGRDSMQDIQVVASVYFNPLAPCGARPFCQKQSVDFLDISTHSPRAGRDLYESIPDFVSAISIHSPRAGRDATSVTVSRFFMPFQPTRPVRGETFRRQRRHEHPGISTHSPRAGRDEGLAHHAVLTTAISIHSPRAGRDTSSSRRSPALSEFQPTRPAWGETSWQASCIHRPAYFNPLAPRGARLCHDPAHTLELAISTHSPRVGRDRKSLA